MIENPTFRFEVRWLHYPPPLKKKYDLMTPLQKGRFPQFSVQKWGKVVKNDIKLSSQSQVNTENTSQVGRKPPPF